MQKRLLEAAMRVVLKRGYNGFRIAEVAKEARTSRGALLHHYPTKEDLVIATVEHAYELLSSRTHERVNQSVGIKDPLEAVILDGKEFFFSDLFSILMDIRISAAKDPLLQSKSRELAEHFRVPVEEKWKIALIESGLKPEEAEDAVWLSLSIVRGMAIRRFWQDTPEKFERLYDLWREIFWTYRQAKKTERSP